MDVANIESSALTDNTSAVVEPSAATVTAETATTNTAVTDVTPTPTDVTTSNVTPAAINTDTVQTPAVATEAATVIKPVAAITTDTSTAAVTPTATADVAGADVTVAPALALTFAADCWIDIRDANGKRLESGLKTAGQTLAVDGKAPFRVRLGAPSAVKIEIKGQPFDLSRYPAGRPVTLTLP
ncbi:RodZ domain-containing protein [Photobacterium aquimaris]|uniref:RodZ domain-containing protein n=1 Tax=Photobacterium aquimaris TaxID=512643 RepID=UPI0009ED1E11|nr:RodZ domain-containing protein [Photobacterium aquimaris]